MPPKHRRDQLKNTKEIDPKHKTSDTANSSDSNTPFTLYSLPFTTFHDFCNGFIDEIK